MLFDEAKPDETGEDFACGVALIESRVARSFTPTLSPGRYTPSARAARAAIHVVKWWPTLWIGYSNRLPCEESRDHPRNYRSKLPLPA
jgi:hypothetical protein